MGKGHYIQEGELQLQFMKGEEKQYIGEMTVYKEKRQYVRRDR